MKVVIIDYGLGNIRSVAGAVKKSGFIPVVSGSPEDILSADRLILPGVGAFGDGMKNLESRGLHQVLTEAVITRRIPILGICLGSQLMAGESFEFGHHRGLGWIAGSVVKFELQESGLRVPHVGWNELIQLKESKLFKGIPPQALFYFVHSFYLKNNDPQVAIGACDYGIRFTCAFEQANIFGTQFHPEKSQYWGLQLIKNFLQN